MYAAVMVYSPSLNRFSDDVAIPIHAVEIVLFILWSSWFRCFCHGQICAGTSVFVPFVSLQIFQSVGESVSFLIGL